VASILKNGLDRVELKGRNAPTQTALPLHENVRGSDYYKKNTHINKGLPPQGENEDAQ
jgi:hypothetical protein